MHRGIHEPSPVGSAFTPPTPPPVSSTAALPPFQLGHGGAGDIKRHQSLNQGYGRLQRERLERTNALLSLDQREEEARRRAGSRGENHEPPPTSPIGPSMWSAQAGENGWSTNLNGLAETFDGLQLHRREAMAGYQAQAAGGGGGARRMGETDLLPPMPATAGPMGEPSWVANLVGHDVAPLRSAHSPNWTDRDALLRQHQQGMLPPHQQRWDQGHVPLAYLQQQQQQQLQGAYGLAMKAQYPGYAPPNPGYMGGAAPMYPSPPVSAHMLGPQDQAVIELARAKGLNPATYNCRPPVVSTILSLM